MFEDSTFESAGRIRTRSRGWMIAAFTFNGSILLALVLIPLIYPEALPRQAIAFLMEAPAPPPAPQAPQQLAHTDQSGSSTASSPFQPPRQIPNSIFMPSEPEPANISIATNLDSGVPGGASTVFQTQTGRPVVTVARPEPKGPMPVSSAVEAGLLIYKAIPVYPTIGVAVRAQGAVVLQATISRSGTIENLRVVSGPPILQQAAMDAVKTWRYKPYMLDGQPAAVETTINVIFSLGG
jgi:protein TonB